MTTKTLIRKKKSQKQKKGKAGRKPSLDPKIQVQFWIETSKVEKVGGMEKTREICIQHLNNQ